LLNWQRRVVAEHERAAFGDHDLRQRLSTLFFRGPHEVVRRHPAAVDKNLTQRLWRAAHLLHAHRRVEPRAVDQSEPDEDTPQAETVVGRGNADHAAIFEVEKEFVAVGVDRQPPGLAAARKHRQEIGHADIERLSHEGHAVDSSVR
jgi:hypothetical protein